ncbi:MAG: BlaI/MecI/CopY family transcriptional regulator [Lachnospiraceae bacterium]|nr:BlaI/MecI/CopY family transcriptional regulator [Lachnospiraceae bacterium]
MLHLSDTEWKLMNRLWEQEATIMELTKEIGEEQDWTKSTIITMLNRLEKKGAVAYREEGRAKRYYPLIDRELAAVRETEDFLDKVYQGSVAMLVNAMVGNKKLKGNDVRELRALLSQWEQVEAEEEDQ